MTLIKTYLYPLTIFLLCYISISCKKESETKPEIILAKEKLVFPMAGESQVLAIKANLSWKAESSESWLTISPASGVEGTKQLSIQASSNTTDAPREATITITVGSLSKQVKISQTFEKLLLDKKLVNVEAASGEITINIQSTADYTSTIQSSWLSLKSTSEDKKTQTFSVAENNTFLDRNGKIVFKMGAINDTVVVKQKGISVWIASDATGMSSNAKTLASQMFLGWNIGNTLEAPGSETGWGNPKISQALIDSVKAAGFNTIRLPCAWNSHLEDVATYKINTSWLARVKEVVDNCYKANLYVIINIHWDGGWLEENPTFAKQETVNQEQKALWQQIAVYFRDYDEHLLFAGTNEVHAGYGAPTQENITVQLSFNQTFVDAVRSTGGKNAYRNLIVQAYNTNIDLAVKYLKMPTDNISDRLFAEVHYYDPWDFCGDDKSSIYLWGIDFKQYGTVSSYGQETYMDQQFAKMKANFVDKGIPVILGEFGAMLRTSLAGSQLVNHKNSRAYYFKYLASRAKNNGIVPVAWDNGGTGNNSMGLFYRATGERFDIQSINALVEGATEGKYPF